VTQSHPPLHTRPQKRKANPSAQQHQDPLLSHPAKEPAKISKFTYSRDTIFAEYVGDKTHGKGAHCWSPQETRLRLPERVATGPCRSGLGGAGHQTPCAYAIVDQCPTDQSNDPFSPHRHPQLRTTIPQENIFQYFRNGKYLKDFTCWTCILNILLTNT
jgi:hypothetical protein